MSQMTPYQNFIAVSRYARWLEEENRRESWPETAGRYISFMRNHLSTRYGYDPKDPIFDEVQSAITALDCVPSMRAIMTAGPALERNHLAGYNCSFIAVNDPRVFDEAMYVLMNGTGLGFSVERKHVEKLPVVPEVITQSDEVIIVGDSKEGWAKAYRALISELYNGRVLKWDVSEVRPAGERLKTFGGRASGPQPLVDLFHFTISSFKGAAGRRLSPIECHDLMCKVGDIVVVGGVRRSALISLSDLDNFDMAKAKSGNWWENEGQRALANNSVTYYNRPSSTQFLREWRNLIESQSGERGIFNLAGIRKHTELMGNGRDAELIEGTNPCGEISLRDMGLCNLSEVIIRETDTIDDVRNKVRLATIIGTWQSTLTDFPYMRAGWRANAEEERLLGVSLTGIYSHRKFNDPSDEGLPKRLAALRKHTHDVNAAEAAKVGVSASKAITTVKPSGCRPWDGLTTTDRGILTLEEMFAASGHVEGEDWKEFDGYRAVQSSDGAGSAISKTFDNGKSEVFSINTHYGMSMESTEDHPWFVSRRALGYAKYVDVNDWVATKDLVEGDILEMVPGIYQSTIEAEFSPLTLRSLNMRSDATDILQPTHMTPDIAWMLGYLWGDGSLSESKYRIRWIDENREHLEKANRVMLENFGIEGVIHSASQHRKALTLEIGNKTFWHWLMVNRITKYDAAGGGLDLIPEAVRRSSTESIIAFLAGLLDSDGWVGAVPTAGGENRIVFTGSDERFMKHVQDVALAVGIVVGRSHNTKGENLQPVKSMYLMTMAPESTREATDVLRNHSVKIARRENLSFGWPCDRVTSTTRTLGKVTSVESLGFKETFDIEVSDTHWFYAGGVKSHNTVSQLALVSSGIHPWHSPYYIRTVRASNNDPLTRLMKDAGVPNEPDFTKPDKSTVFSFPTKAPEGAITRTDISALEHLRLYSIYRNSYTDHNVSITVSVKESEWISVGAWVFENWDSVGGVSFLPYSDHVYEQAPYQDCTKEEYEVAMASFPTDVRFADLHFYESEDGTTGNQTLACTAAGCEAVDLT